MMVLFRLLGERSSTPAVVLAMEIAAVVALDRHVAAGPEAIPPDPADPLLSMPNVICTPHVAAWTWDGVQNVGWHGARNLWAMISGEGEPDIVNPEARRSRHPRSK